MVEPASHVLDTGHSGPWPPPPRRCRCPSCPSSATTQRDRGPKKPAACNQPLVHMAVSVFVPPACSVCSVRSCAQQSCAFRSHSWPCCGQLGLRYEPLHLAVRHAVLHSAGRLPCVSLSDSLSCVQVGLRPAASASRYPGARLTAACSYFLGSVKIGRGNPPQDLTPLPIRAGSLLLAQALIFRRLCRRFNLTYIWIRASGDVRFPVIPEVNKIWWRPVICTWTTPLLHSAVLHNNSTNRSANVRMP